MPPPGNYDFSIGKSLNVGIYDLHYAEHADDLIARAQSEGKNLTIIQYKGRNVFKVSNKGNVLWEALKRTCGYYGRTIQDVQNFRATLPNYVAPEHQSLATSLAQAVNANIEVTPEDSDSVSSGGVSDEDTTIEVDLASSEMPYIVQLSEQQKLDLDIDEEYKQRLNEAIELLEDSFKNNDWAHAGLAMKEFVPALVLIENLKKPRLNLKYCSSPAQLGKEIADAVAKGISEGRFIVKTERGNHMAYFDFKMVGQIPSVLNLDSAPFSNMVPTLLASEVNRALKASNPAIRYAAIDTNIQHSAEGCPVFSLNLAKQVFKNPEGLAHLHLRNAQGELTTGAEQNDVPSFNVRVDADVPPSLMKHSQSSKRTKEYLEANPAVANVPVNKKGDTLSAYQQKHKSIERFDGQEKMLVDGIFVKRLKYLKELRDAI